MEGLALGSSPTFVFLERCPSFFSAFWLLAIRLVPQTPFRFLPASARHFHELWRFEEAKERANRILTGER
jgi:hypothetical protein